MADPVWLLDLSRLLARAGAPGPTGIDRVELAYARYLLSGRLRKSAFCALHPLGVSGGIPSGLAADFVSALSEWWSASSARRQSGESGEIARLKRRIGRDLLWRPLPRQRRMVHLLLSHHHLTRPRAIAMLLRATGSFFVPMVHDVIPLDFPEYGRPKEEQRHAQRIATVASLADGVLVPTRTVRNDLCRHVQRPLPVWVVPHGVASACSWGGCAQSEVTVPERPYFVYLSTIEPRKNHLMLLQVWRRLVEVDPQAAPVLVLIGKRGWENENVLDLLDRSKILRPYVVEYNALPDEAVTQLLKSAVALLFPSLVEGYGLPVAEALAMGVPVICSDIPVLHEVGGKVADYVDPLNGAAWAEIVSEYVANGLRRQNQLRKLAGWVSLSWEKSITQALARIEKFLARDTCF